MRTRNFGRLVAKDRRDRKFPMSLCLPRRSARTTRNWYDLYWFGDQGSTPQCVAYAWTHYGEDSPIIPGGKIHPFVKPSIIYKAAQAIDEWKDEPHDGTSVRAMAKIFKDRGYISAYLWAQVLDDIVLHVLEKGPVVVGTNWYAGMSEPGARSGLMSAKGDLEGGHAYLINGVNTIKKQFRIKNSWNQKWGIQGRAYLSFVDAKRLIFREDGEACVATEKGIKAPIVEGRKQ